MKIKVENYSMYPSKLIVGTKGSYGFEFIELELGEGWEGLAVKLIFQPPVGEAVSIVYAGEPVPVPYEVTRERGRTSFCVVGYEGEKTRITVSGELDVLQALEPEGVNTAPPTESEMTQALEYMEQAVSVARSIREDADSGAFKGEKGDRGEKGERGYGGPKIYSVRFAGGGIVGTREDDAVGMVAEVAVGGETVRNDFDSISFFNRRICNATWDPRSCKWRVSAYREDPFFSLTGGGGDVLYECTPFYISDNTDINEYVSVCGSPCEGYSLAPMFKNGHDKVYLPCFESHVYNSYGKYTVRSISGVMPTVMTNELLRDAVDNNVRMCPETAQVYFSETVLQLVEFATKDLCSVMSGVIDLLHENGAVVIDKGGTNSLLVEQQYGEQLVVGQSIRLYDSDEDVWDELEITNIVHKDDGTSEVFVNTSFKFSVAGRTIQAGLFKTGVAISAVTSASSGAAVSKTDGKHPCVWRGKENPWGNGESVLHNLFSYIKEPRGERVQMVPIFNYSMQGIYDEAYIEYVIEARGNELYDYEGTIVSIARNAHPPFVFTPVVLDTECKTGFGYCVGGDLDGGETCRVAVGGKPYGKRSGIAMNFKNSTYENTNDYLVARFMTEQGVDYDK